MIVTTVEFQNNFVKYLRVLSNEDVFVVENGQTVAKISNPNITSVEAISGALGNSASSDINSKTLREERLSEYAARHWY